MTSFNDQYFLQNTANYRRNDVAAFEVPMSLKLWNFYFFQWLLPFHSSSGSIDCENLVMFLSLSMKMRTREKSWIRSYGKQVKSLAPPCFMWIIPIYFVCFFSVGSQWTRFLWILNQNHAKNSCVYIGINKIAKKHRYAITLRPNDVSNGIYANRIQTDFSLHPLLLHCINLIFTIHWVFHYFLPWHHIK